MKRLARAELKKNTRPVTVCLLIVLAALRIVLSIFHFPYSHEYTPEVYKRLIQGYAGEYSEETKARISEDYEELLEIIGSKGNMETAYLKGELSLTENAQFLDSYYKALSEKDSMEYLLKRCDHLDTVQKDTELFYDTPWLDIFKNDKYDYLTLIAVLVLTIPVFGGEYSSGSRRLLLSTPLGRTKMAAAKLLASGMPAFAVSLMMSVVGIIPVITSEGGGVAWKSTYDLLGYNMDVPLIIYYLEVSLFRAFLWLVLAVMTCMLGVLIRNAVIVFFVSAVLSVVPGMLSCPGWCGLLFCSCAIRDAFSYGYATMIRSLLLAVLRMAVYVFVTIFFWSRTEKESK